jgi:hypothetical protein
MLTYTASVMRILLLLLFLGAPSVLHAQEADLSNLSPGTWVRVQAPTLFQGRSEAMVWKLSPDTLYLGGPATGAQGAPHHRGGKDRGKTR